MHTEMQIKINTNILTELEMNEATKQTQMYFPLNKKNGTFVALK